jgi:regulator of CtrA degradation
VRARELWRVQPDYLDQAQDDATLIAIRDQERAGLDIITDGEMRREDASARKYRIRRDEPPLDPEAQKGKGLPPRFLELVGRAEALYEQICRLDEALYQPASKARAAANPVSDQIAALQKAAETGAFDPLMVWRRK